MMSRCPLTPAGQGWGCRALLWIARRGRVAKGGGGGWLVVRPVDSLLWARALHPRFGKGCQRQSHTVVMFV